MIRCIEKKRISRYNSSNTVCSSSIPANVWPFLFCQCLLWTSIIFNKKIIHNYLGKIFRDLIYICVCAMRAMWRRRQRLNVAGAGNVARMRRDSWATPQRTRAVRATPRGAPLERASPDPPRTQRAGHWGSSGLDKAFSAQPGQATLLSSHTYTLQG